MRRFHLPRRRRRLADLERRVADLEQRQLPNAVVFNTDPIAGGAEFDKAMGDALARYNRRAESRWR